VFGGLCGFSLCAYNISLYHLLFKIKFKLKLLYRGECYLVIINYHQLVDGEGGLQTATKAVYVCVCICLLNKQGQPTRDRSSAWGLAKWLTVPTVKMSKLQKCYKQPPFSNIIWNYLINGIQTWDF